MVIVSAGIPKNSMQDGRLMTSSLETISCFFRSFHAILSKIHLGTFEAAHRWPQVLGKLLPMWFHPSSNQTKTACSWVPLALNGVLPLTSDLLQKASQLVEMLCAGVFVISELNLECQSEALASGVRCYVLDFNLSRGSALRVGTKLEYQIDS
jgi:hypothetical protein